MKIRISKTAIIAIIFIFLMAGSTIALGIQRLIEPTGSAINLPETNIIDYELGIREEEYLINKGVTVVKFYYLQNCLDCYKQKTFLESFANQYSNQILLEEVLSSQPSGTYPLTIVKSYSGQRSFTNATNDDVTDALCDFMIQPPAMCAVRKV